MVNKDKGGTDVGMQVQSTLTLESVGASMFNLSKDQGTDLNIYLGRYRLNNFWADRCSFRAGTCL